MGKPNKPTQQHAESNLKRLNRPMAKKKNRIPGQSSSKDSESLPSSACTAISEDDSTNDKQVAQKGNKPGNVDVYVSNPLDRRDAVKFRNIYLHGIMIDCPASPWLLADHAMRILLTTNQHHNKQGSCESDVTAKPILIFGLNENSIPAEVNTTASIQEMFYKVRIKNVELVSYNGNNGIYYRKRARETRIKGDGVKSIKKQDAFDFYRRLESGNVVGSPSLSTTDQLRVLIEDELANTTIKNNVLVDDLEVAGDFGTLQELNYIHNPVDYFLPGFGGNIPKVTIVGSYLLSPSVMTTGGFLSIHALAKESIGSRCWLIYTSESARRRRPIHVDLNSSLRENGDGSLHSLIGKQFTEQCCKWMESGLVLFHPIKLREMGIVIDIYIQKPGEFAILPPYTCYSTYDTGKGVVFSSLLLPPTEFIDYGLQNYLDYEEKYKYSSGCGQRWKTPRNQREQACKHFMPFNMKLKECNLKSFYDQNKERCEKSDIKHKILFKPLHSLSITNKIRQMCSLGLWVSVPDHGKNKKVAAIIIKPTTEDSDYYLAQRCNVKSTSHVVHKKWIATTYQETQRKFECQPTQNNQIALNLNTIGRVYRRWMPFKEHFKVNRILKREKDEDLFEKLHEIWEGQLVDVSEDNTSSSSSEDEQDLKPFKIPTFCYVSDEKEKKKSYDWEMENVESDLCEDSVLGTNVDNETKSDEEDMQVSVDHSCNSNVQRDSLIGENNNELNDDVNGVANDQQNNPQADLLRETGNGNRRENVEEDDLVLSCVGDNEESGSGTADVNPSVSLNATQTSNNNKSIVYKSKIVSSEKSANIGQNVLCHKTNNVVFVARQYEQYECNMPTEVKTFIDTMSRVLYSSRELVEGSGNIGAKNHMTEVIQKIIRPEKLLDNKDNIKLLCTVTDRQIKTSCGFHITLRDAQQFENERHCVSTQQHNIGDFLKNHSDRVVLFSNFSPVCGFDCIFHVARPHGEIEAIYMSNEPFIREDSIVREIVRIGNIEMDSESTEMNQQTNIPSTKMDMVLGSGSGVIVFKTTVSAQQCNATTYMHYNKYVSFFMKQLCSVSSEVGRPNITTHSESGTTISVYKQQGGPENVSRLINVLVRSKKND